MAEFNILTPNAMLGYGYRLDHFWYGVKEFKPKAIIVDSGSTDGGPYKLGLNKMTCGRDSYIRDLTPILQACFYHGIKVLIGSVGGDGSDKHVQEMLEMVQEIAKTHGFSFNVATISAGIDQKLVKGRIEGKKVGPCGPVEELTVESVDRAIDIVAQMGAEPLVKALVIKQDSSGPLLTTKTDTSRPFHLIRISFLVVAPMTQHHLQLFQCT